MFTLDQSNVLRIQLFVPRDAAIGVKPGIDAVVRIPELPGRTFPGKVTGIADALDPATRTLLTEIDLRNPNGELSPGMYCTVELKVPRKTRSLIVPAGAIVFDAEGLHALVVANGTVHSRRITEVRDLGTEVEVSDGVDQGGACSTNRSRRWWKGAGSQSDKPKPPHRRSYRLVGMHLRTSRPASYGIFEALADIVENVALPIRNLVL
jgi:Barrel-sandwich domain of CusB or HlyD membrane-fusion